MKVNFKRMITALAAAAMCAVPMTSAMSASAAPYDQTVEGFELKGGKTLKNGDEEDAKLAYLKKKIDREIFLANIDDRKVVNIDFERQPSTPNPDYFVASIAESNGISLADSVNRLYYPDPEAPPKDWGPLTPFVRGNGSFIIR